jgi:hypothetical protein
MKILLFVNYIIFNFSRSRTLSSLKLLVSTKALILQYSNFACSLILLLLLSASEMPTHIILRKARLCAH